MRLYISKSDACWGPSGGSRGGARGARPPSSPTYSQTKIRPERREENFGDRPPPPLFKGLDDIAPLLSRGLDLALGPSVRYRVSCQTGPFLVFFVTRQEQRRIKLGAILKKKYN